jgi:hypothetical protein
MVTASSNPRLLGLNGEVLRRTIWTQTAPEVVLDNGDILSSSHPEICELSTIGSHTRYLDVVDIAHMVLSKKPVCEQEMILSHIKSYDKSQEPCPELSFESKEGDTDDVGYRYVGSHSVRLGRLSRDKKKEEARVLKLEETLSRRQVHYQWCLERRWERYVKGTSTILFEDLQNDTFWCSDEEKKPENIIKESREFLKMQFEAAKSEVTSEYEEAKRVSAIVLYPLKQRRLLEKAERCFHSKMRMLRRKYKSDREDLEALLEKKFNILSFETKFEHISDRKNISWHGMPPFGVIQTEPPSESNEQFEKFDGFSVRVTDMLLEKAAKASVNTKWVPAYEEHKLLKDFRKFFFEMVWPKIKDVAIFADFAFPYVDLLYRCYYSRSISDILMALTAFVNQVLGFADLVNGVVLDKCASMLWDSFKKKFTIPVTESLSETVDATKSLIQVAYNSSAVTALRNLIMSMASLKLFDKDIATKIYMTMGRPEKMDMMSMTLYIMTQVQEVLRVGEALVAGVPYSKALGTDNAKATFPDRVRDLLFYTTRTYTGMPVEDKMDRSEFIYTCNNMIAEGEYMLKNVSPRDVFFSHLKKLILDMRAARMDVQGQINGGRRPVPFMIILHGEPGIGKSVILEFLCQLWCHTRGITYKSDMMYSRPKTSDFWEGYDPYSQIIIHLSEIGNAKAKIAEMRGDDAVMEFTSLGDALPYPVDRARLEDKGNCWARPEMIIVDTNNPSLNYDVLCDNKAALQRRCIYIEPKVKPQFLKKMGHCEIDASKSLQFDDKIADRWTFNVYKYTAVTKKHAEREDLMSMNSESDDIYALSKLFSNLFEKHISIQDRVTSEVVHKVKIEDYLPKRENEIPMALPIVESDLGLDNGSGYITDHILVNDESRLPDQPFVESWANLAVRYWTFGKRVFFTGWHIALLYSFINLVTILRGRKGAGIKGEIGVIMSMILFYFSAFVHFALFCGIGALTTMILLRFFNQRSSKWFVTQTALVYSCKVKLSHARARWRRTWNCTTNYLNSTWWEAHKYEIAGAITFLGGIGAVYHLFFRKRDKEESVADTEDHSDFLKDSDFNDTLNKYEDEMSCGRSYERIPIKGTKIWNVKSDPLIGGVHTGTIEGLSQRFSTNIRSCLVLDCANPDRKEGITHILGIQANFALINTHAISTMELPRLRVSSGLEADKSTVFHDTDLNHLTMVKLSSDVSLVKLTGVLFRDDGIKHIIPEILPKGKYVGLFCNRKVPITVTGASFPVRSNGEIVQYDDLAQYPFAEHKVGLCGTPLFATVGKTACLVGMHVAGVNGTDMAYSVLFRKREIIEAMELLQSKSNLMPLVSEGELRFESIGEPMAKSAFRYLPLHGVRYFGKLPGKVIINQKSRIVRSSVDLELDSLFEDMLKFKSVKNMMPPILQPFKRDGEWISPYNINLHKISRQKGCLDESIINKCVEEFTEHILKGLADKGVTKVDPLTVDVAINGAINDKFLRRINASTAAGYGFAGKKDSWIPVVDSKPGKVIREPVAELKKKLVDMLERYKNEETWRPVCEGSLKDEVRPEEKVRIGKVRMFYTGELDFLILSRMLLAPFYTLMNEFSDIFGCAIGINMHSQADEFARKLIEFSNKILEGDYGMFDTSIANLISHAAASVMYNVLERLGYPPEALTALRGLLTDGLFPVIVVLLDVFEVPGMTTSGHYGTAERNSLIVVLLLLYAWHALEDKPEGSFFKHVLNSDYGDDMEAGVSDEASVTFNCDYLYDLFTHHMLMEFTSTSKDGKPKPYVSIQENTFLKRRFVYREDFKRWVACLDLESLYKSVVWIEPSSTISLLEQTEQTYVSLLWEVFLILREKKFNQFRSRLMDIFSKQFGHPAEFPTHAEILSQIF